MYNIFVMHKEAQLEQPTGVAINSLSGNSNKGSLPCKTGLGERYLAKDVIQIHYSSFGNVDVHTCKDLNLELVTKTAFCHKDAV